MSCFPVSPSTGAHEEPPVPAALPTALAPAATTENVVVPALTASWNVSETANARSARARARQGTGVSGTEVSGIATETVTGGKGENTSGAQRSGADEAPAGSIARRRSESGNVTERMSAAGGRRGTTTTSATGTETRTKRGRGSGRRTRGPKVETGRSVGIETTARTNATGRRRRASAQVGAAAKSAGTSPSAPARSGRVATVAAGMSSQRTGIGIVAGRRRVARVASGTESALTNAVAAQNASAADAAKAQTIAMTALLDDRPLRSNHAHPPPFHSSDQTTADYPNLAPPSSRHDSVSFRPRRPLKILSLSRPTSIILSRSWCPEMVV